MGLSDCNVSDTFQAWNATVSDPVINATRFHVNYQGVDICMRLMVWHEDKGDCDTKQENTGMDVFPCTTSHCGNHSNAWLLPTAGPGAIHNAWSAHCLDAALDGTSSKITTQPCSGASNQEWTVVAGQGYTMLRNGLGKCLSYSTPTPVDDQPVLVTDMPDGAYASVFNMADSDVNVTLHLDDILTNVSSASETLVNDIWAEHVVQVSATGNFTVLVPSHGVVFLSVATNATQLVIL